MSFESTKGYVGYEWDMVAERARFMGGARRAYMRNFRGKYDIANTAKGGLGFLLSWRRIVREEKITGTFYESG
eukprot:scaffold126751_cov19-Tisochrysis_lutea.AAC.1